MHIYVDLYRYIHKYITSNVYSLKSLFLRVLNLISSTVCPNSYVKQSRVQYGGYRYDLLTSMHVYGHRLIHTFASHIKLL